MPAARAVLFDLDGTILTTGGAGRRAMGAAIDEVLGLNDSLAHFHLDGMTDRSIVRRAAEERRSTCTPAEIDACIERYLMLLAEGVAATKEYVVLPGVADLARRLAGRGVAVGLGTGNVERGARIKLSRSGLNPLFTYGGFGDEHEDRARLVAAGVEAARIRCGGELRGDEVWIIGDTPKDISAGQAVGARILAVATGRYSVEELQSHRPDVAVATLADPSVVDLLARG